MKNTLLFTSHFSPNHPVFTFPYQVLQRFVFARNERRVIFPRRQLTIISLLFHRKLGEPATLGEKRGVPCPSLSKTQTIVHKRGARDKRKEEIVYLHHFSIPTLTFLSLWPLSLVPVHFDSKLLAEPFFPPVSVPQRKISQQHTNVRRCLCTNIFPTPLPSALTDTPERRSNRVKTSQIQAARETEREIKKKEEDRKELYKVRLAPPDIFHVSNPRPPHLVVIPLQRLASLFSSPDFGCQARSSEDGAMPKPKPEPPFFPRKRSLSNRTPCPSTWPRVPSSPFSFTTSLSRFFDSFKLQFLSQPFSSPFPTPCARHKPYRVRSPHRAQAEPSQSRGIISLLPAPAAPVLFRFLFSSLGPHCVRSRFTSHLRLPREAPHVSDRVPSALEIAPG